MQFEDEFNGNGHSSDSDDVADEQNNQELEGESPRGGIGSEEGADSESHYGHDDPLYAQVQQLPLVWP